MSRTAGVVLCALCACGGTADRARQISPESVAPAPSVAFAGPTASVDTAAIRQFDAWLAAFNSGDRAKLLSYHDRHCAYAVVSEDIANIDREERLSKGTGGFDVKKVESRSATSVAVTLKERALDGFARVELAVAEVDPGRVERLEIHPIPTPDEFLSADERTARIVDDARKRMLIDKAAQALTAHYVFPDKAEEMNAALRRHLAAGDYDEIADAAAFAEALTRDLRAVSHDLHLGVRFGRRAAEPEPTSDELPQHLRSINFGFGAIERLQGNVAHMVIDGFPPIDNEVAREAVGTLMTKVADADALIIDLRDNGGGQPRTVALVMSYVFDSKPVHIHDMYSRDTGSITASWTLRDVKGERFGSKKPLYVLTSQRTFSGGEGFAYTLQSLHRAKIVGETTGGGAHPVGPTALDDWFTIRVPWGRPINPITKTNWEGTGVVPDIAVPATAALAEAHRRALADLAALDVSP